MRCPIFFPLGLIVLGLIVSQRLASATNHPMRSFTFEDRGPEVAKLYRLGLENKVEHVPTFCEALKSDDLAVRKAAIAQLVFTHDKSAFDPLIGAMKDESSWVRRGAIAVLERLADKRAIPALQEALTFVPGPPRTPAGPGQDRGLGGPASMGMGGGRGRSEAPQQSTVLRQEEYFNRLAAALALHRLGSDAGVPTVMAILKGPHEKPVLQMAINCATIMDLKQATPDLLKMASECQIFGEDTPGFFAIRALRTMGDPAFRPQILQLAKDKFNGPGMFIRMEALNLIGVCGDESAVPLLREAIADKRNSREHQRAIVEAFRKLRPNDAAALLTKYYLMPGEADARTGQISQANERAFQLAAEAVADLKDTSVLADLKASYARFSQPTDYFHCRLYLAYAMAALGDGFGFSELHKALEHEDAAVRRLAAKLLGRLGSNSSVAPLAAALRAETDGAAFQTIKASLQKRGAPAEVTNLPAPPAPAPPPDTFNKPRYLCLSFDDCTTIESLERFVGLMDELADQDVRWVCRMFVAGQSRHDFQYAIMMLQRCFDRGCEMENHSLHHDADGAAITARTADDVRLDCGGGINWLHGNIIGLDRIYTWKSGGSGFARPGDPQMNRDELRELVREGFWAKNIEYSWPGVERAIPDYYAPPYHLAGASSVSSWAVNGDLSYGYDVDTVEEGVHAFAESLDHWYFHQPDRVFMLEGHDWPNSFVPIRTGHETHWGVLSGFLREALLNRRDRYPQLYCMTPLELTHIFRRGLTPEQILDLDTHLQNSPEF
jgi:HEAT repeat protein